MSVNELIIAGEADEPGSVTYWTRGKDNDLKGTKKRPVLGGATPVSCRMERQEIAEVQIKLVDPALTREFQVRLRCDARIRPDRVEALILARAHHSGIDMAICNVARRALNSWRSSSSFIDQLFPKGERKACVEAVRAVSNALDEIGLHIETVQIEPLGWNSDERVPLILGPRRVHCKDDSGALSVTINGELVHNNQYMAAFLTAREASAGKASIKDAVEVHIFDWLDGRYSRHQHSYDASLILSELRNELNDYCGRRFGRSAIKLNFENSIIKSVGPEPEAIEFTHEYNIAASNANMKMTHRGTVIVTDVGRAPGGLAQRRAEAEQRIKTAIQSHILTFSASKVLSELHTFADENANTLSRWVMENNGLISELAARGLTLATFYVFTNEQSKVPLEQGRAYRHITSYHISGTDRVLTLIHNLFWRIGPSRAQKSAYIEFGSPALEIFESNILGKELDAQTSRRLLDKTFDTIVFEYFYDQGNTERALTTELQVELKKFAEKFGVEVTTMTTVFETLPEARLLTGDTIDVADKIYSLADSRDQIELSAKVKVKVSHGGDASLLRKHLSGADCEAIFTKIREGIVEQIDFFLAGIEPWEIFSMRDQQGDVNGNGHQVSGSAPPLIRRIRDHVADWLLANFGLEIVEPDGFRLPIGSCALIEARQRLIGAEGEVKVDAHAHVERFNSEYGIDVRVAVGITIPFRIDAVGSRPEDRRRFMETFRAMYGAANGADAILGRVRSIIENIVSGMIQRIPAATFNSRNFAKHAFAQAFADASIQEVLDSLGLVLYVSHRRVLPSLDSAFVPESVILLQDTLRFLTTALDKERRNFEFADQDKIEKLRNLIAETKCEIKTNVEEHGVGGSLDTKALNDAFTELVSYLESRGIKSTLLAHQTSGKQAGSESTSLEKSESVVDAEFEEVEGRHPDNESI